MSTSDYPKTKSFWAFVTEKISPVALAVVLLVVLALGTGAFIYVLNSQRTIVNLVQQNRALALLNLNSQTDHHASAARKDAELQQALNEANAALVELKTDAAEIKYLTGVAAYQNGVIINDHTSTAAALALIDSVISEIPQFKTDVISGVGQINTYLSYLTCLTTHTTNVAVCGAVPSLPSTTSSAS